MVQEEFKEPEKEKPKPKSKKVSVKKTSTFLTFVTLKNSKGKVKKMSIEDLPEGWEAKKEFILEEEVFEKLEDLT